MTRGKRGGKRKGQARATGNPRPAPVQTTPASLPLLALLAAGAIAMIAGACTFSWWRFSAGEGLGLRELHVCAFDTCKPYDYATAAGVDAPTWVTLGTLACYGAFVVAAIGLIAGVSAWRNLAATTSLRATAVLAVALLGAAIAFIVMRPNELNLSEGEFERARLFMRATTIGGSAIAYLAGAVAIAFSSALLSRRR